MQGKQEKKTHHGIKKTVVSWKRNSNKATCPPNEFGALNVPFNFAHSWLLPS